jgi:hypothetical protein
MVEYLVLLLVLILLVVIEVPGIGSVTRVNPRDRLKPAPFRPGSPRGRF